MWLCKTSKFSELSIWFFNFIGWGTFTRRDLFAGFCWSPLALPLSLADTVWSLIWPMFAGLQSDLFESFMQQNFEKLSWTLSKKLVDLDRNWVSEERGCCCMAYMHTGGAPKLDWRLVHGHSDSIGKKYQQWWRNERRRNAHRSRWVFADWLPDITAFINLMGRLNIW